MAVEADFMPLSPSLLCARGQPEDGKGQVTAIRDQR